jgi:hypothetical protein
VSIVGYSAAIHIPARPRSASRTQDENAGTARWLCLVPASGNSKRNPPHSKAAKFSEKLPFRESGNTLDSGVVWMLTAKISHPWRAARRILEQRRTARLLRISTRCGLTSRIASSYLFAVHGSFKTTVLRRTHQAMAPDNAIARGRAATKRLEAVALGLALACISCQPMESSWSGEIGVAEQAQFEREVYPVLLRDCAYSECHGAPQRYFQIYGPGRTRLEPKKGVDMLAEERRVSYERALSMLITDGSQPVESSPLLVKPLEVGLGGAHHGGRDVFGRNVYRSTSDPAFMTLVRWAMPRRVPWLPSSAAEALPPPSAGAAAPATGPTTTSTATGQ